ncbi:hypothetical protein [Hymenobacter lapidarius]|uniref:hypothetical protein n=1 Tax=Hymenobacter lapidarius TaxID=1908237 RepID=UPI000F7B9334|nr:hypothetical protein [Hymenobacter lapidarius]
MTSAQPAPAAKPIPTNRDEPSHTIYSNGYANLNGEVAQGLLPNPASIFKRKPHKTSHLTPSGAAHGPKMQQQLAASRSPWVVQLLKFAKVFLGSNWHWPINRPLHV